VNVQGTGPYSVFVDANVRYSRTLRDWLGMLYTTPDTPPFVVHWSEDFLVTTNTVDFTWDDNTSPYELMSPDDFLVLVDDSAPELVAAVAADMCQYWVDRTGGADPCGALRVAGCPVFADRVLAHLHRHL